MKTQFSLRFIALFFLFPSILSAQTDTGIPTEKNILEIFNGKLSDKVQLKDQDQLIRRGGYPDNNASYIRIDPSSSPAEITGLSVPIRENPGPGEYRYITFAWMKVGAGQVGMKFGHTDSSDNATQNRPDYDYTYIGGVGRDLAKGLRVTDITSGEWVITTRDLWRDFGDFVLTGVSLLSPGGRYSGFDAIILGQNQEALKNIVQIPVSDVSEPVDVNDEYLKQPDKVEIDWAAQIKAGGFMMYPLYLCALAAIIIALQRIVASREERLAPERLQEIVRENINRRDINGAIEACDKYPSTLAEALSFIFKHRSAGREIVSQTAGDIAGRDIREHLSRVYPLSVIASLSPLLGLLGTIVGMIEAFGLVALYGDEGGAAILSDSISKALITTATGLIIAVPCIAVYFIIRNRIMRQASKIEVEIEKVITDLYLCDNSTILTNPENVKENTDAIAH